MLLPSTRAQPSIDAQEDSADRASSCLPSTGGAIWPLIELMESQGLGLVLPPSCVSVLSQLRSVADIANWEMKLRVTMAWILFCTWSGTSVPPFSMPLFSDIHVCTSMSLRLPTPLLWTNQCSITVENISCDKTSELARYWSSSWPTSSPLLVLHSCCWSGLCRACASARCFRHQTRATPLTRRSIMRRSSGICNAWKASTRAETTPVCIKAMESKMPNRISGHRDNVSPKKVPTCALLASPLRRIIFMAAV
mmetsp:Transcript_16168/g.47150  ORF Transcript_16168/g.47150 Transcript_16168/m.47150 type:complete len:252 (+) Transcript_16168:588-1343(+)